MNYSGKHCPVCKEAFENNENVVVCPECGTPHHRDCYEKTGHCINSDKHGPNFTWNMLEDDNDQENTGQVNMNSTQTIVCGNCGHKNPETALFCENCSTPLGAKQPQPEEQPPFQQEGRFSDFLSGAIDEEKFDPSANVTEDEELVKGVKMKDAVAFVQKNALYYITVFRRIRDTDKGVITLSGFLFTGAFFLYRKQYLKGILISLLMGSLILCSAFFSQYSLAIFNDIASRYATGSLSMEVFLTAFYKLDFASQLCFFIPLLCRIGELAVRMACMLTASKGYFKHTVNKIKLKKIESNGDETAFSKSIEESGGVNLPVAICTIICFLILSYLPTFL